jgi:CDP-glycerol glycerophosphotransferase
MDSLKKGWPVVIKAENPRESLRVSQRGSVLTIAGVYNKADFSPDTIVLVDRNASKDIARVPLETDGSAFAVLIDLAAYDSGLTLDVYFDGQRQGSALRRRQRLGGFRETCPISVENIAGIAPYFTIKGNLSLSSERTRQLPVRLTTESLTFSEGVMNLSATLETFGAPLTGVSVVFSARDGFTSSRVPARFEEHGNPSLSKGLHTYDVNVTVELQEVAKTLAAIVSDILDPVMELGTAWDMDSSPHARIPAPLNRQRRRIRQYVNRGVRSVVVFDPYFTTKAQRLAIRFDRFDPDIYRYMRRISTIAPIFRLVGRIRGTWLIGELPNKARDNGARFFRYVRTHHPERRAFYVVDLDSPDSEFVKEFGNVVDYRSREHVRLAVEAKRIVGTHHLEYVMPTWNRAFTKHVRGVRIFLQHGVMGVKNMVSLYGVGSGLMADHFVVSSLFEREMIVNDFGYRPNQVTVTGLARFDDLLSGPSEPDRRILVVPTWRDWLFTDHDLESSEYLEQWREFLDDPLLEVVFRVEQ